MAFSITVDDSPLHFVCCHLSPHQSNEPLRNREFSRFWWNAQIINRILHEIIFTSGSIQSASSILLVEFISILDCRWVIWIIDWIPPCQKQRLFLDMQQTLYFNLNQTSCCIWWSLTLFLVASQKSRFNSLHPTNTSRTVMNWITSEVRLGVIVFCLKESGPARTITRLWRPCVRITKQSPPHWKQR